MRGGSCGTSNSSLAEAIKWAQKGNTSTTTVSATTVAGGEYARAGQQPTYSPEERAQIEAQLNQEEDDGF